MFEIKWAGVESIKAQSSNLQKFVRLTNVRLGYTKNRKKDSMEHEQTDMSTWAHATFPL